MENTLKSIPDISKWQANNVNDMSNMFSNCLSLKSIPDLKKWNKNNVTEMKNIYDA